MLADLARVHESRNAPPPRSDRRFRLLSQRLQHVLNSSGNDTSAHRRPQFNPIGLHPDDMTELGIADGDVVQVTSDRASIPAVAVGDSDLLRGNVSMAHGFGGRPEDDGRFREIGSAVNRLVDGTEITDPYTAMTRMSNIPVDVTPRG